MVKINVCFLCGFRSHKEGNPHECLIPIELKLKKTRWGLFVDWFFSHDITYHMAFLGGCIINGIFLKYLPLTDSERLIECFCIGVVMMRLFKRE